MAAKAADSFPYRKTKSLNKCSGFLKTCVNRAPISPYLAITSLISAAEGIRPPSLPQPCRRRFCIGNGISQRLQPSSGQARTASGGGLLACPPPVARVVGVVELPEVVVDSIDDGLAQLLARLAAGDERAHAVNELARVAGHGGNGLARLQQAHAAVFCVAAAKVKAAAEPNKRELPCLGKTHGKFNGRDRQNTDKKWPLE